MHLNLSHCGLTSKGVNQLAQALLTNNSMFTTLNYLNLSGNNLKDDISVCYRYFKLSPFVILLFLQHLHNFLGHPNALSHIDISSTDVILENVSSFKNFWHLLTMNFSSCLVL